MATLYWGDGLTKPDGNWNNAANWWTTLAHYGCCCCFSDGNPAGRVPAAGDTVVLVGGNPGGSHAGQLQGNITTGPTAGFAGAISWLNPQGTSLNGISNSNVAIMAGNYSGAVTIGLTSPRAATPSDTQNFVCFGIGGGTFTGTVTLGYAIWGANISPTLPSFFGGTVTGTGRIVRLTQQQVAGNSPNVNLINYVGEVTYTPHASCALEAGGPPYILNPANIPPDVGCAELGTYAPVITVTGVPSGGGTQKPAGFNSHFFLGS
jgi:hypothetical protein